MSEIQWCKCEAGQRALAVCKANEAKKQQRKLDGLFMNAGIPSHFRDFTMETLVQRAKGEQDKQLAISMAQQLVDQGYIVDTRTNRYKFGMVVSGDYGRGKTGLLTPVLRHFVEQGKSGLWIEVYDFFTEVQQGYKDGSSNTKLETAQRVDWALLDDLGDKARVEPETDDKRRILYQLVNYRHNHGLPMLITTNLTGPELATQFGARTLERVMESCAWVTMGGRNLRME